MISRTHDLAAITALSIVAVLYPPQAVSLATILLAVLANQVGGVAPDIDQPTAPLWRNLPIGGPIGRIIDKLLGGHRFLTHSLLGVGLFGFVAHIVLRTIQPLMPSVDTGIVWWAFMIGMVSHLIMDSFTKEGVPWLLPVPVKFGVPPVRRLRLTTGKGMELWVILPALIVFDIWWCATHYTNLLALLHYAA